MPVRQIIILLATVCNLAVVTDVDVSHSWVHEEPIELLDFVNATHCLVNARFSRHPRGSVALDQGTY
jgi:hypothetical protein